MTVTSMNNRAVRNLTFGDLRTILVDCAGLAEGVELSERHLDTELDLLGYDSLAVLETTARIKREFGVDIPDSEVVELRTPRMILDRVNTVVGAADASTRLRYAEHSLELDAPPDRVFALLTDVSLWPVIFAPTVHTRTLERSEQGDRFQIWATQGAGEVNYWISGRRFDAEAGVITFAQERESPLFGFMGGRWTVRPIAGGRTEVVLGHSYRPNPDEPDAEETLRRLLAENDATELAALRVVATLPEELDTLLVRFTETMPVTGPAESVYRFLWDADRWPRRLPHVAEVELIERPGNGQDLTMRTRTPDGSVHITRSVRVGLDTGGQCAIAYKQTRPPAPLLGHSGLWEILAEDSGLRLHSTHTALIDPCAAAEMFGADTPIEQVARRVHTALAANSRTTMEHAARFSAAAGAAR